MKKPTKPGRLMVRMVDPDGATRAWAAGPADEIETVRNIAEAQLKEYRAAKRKLGDPLAYADYAEVIQPVKEEGGEAS